jgi:hypothetical protein
MGKACITNEGEEDYIYVVSGKAERKEIITKIKI